MAEYKPYTISVIDPRYRSDIKNELTKEVPPEYSIPSYIPPRIVSIYAYLPSRVSDKIGIYYLTDEEAEILKGDSRIEYIYDFNQAEEESDTIGSTQDANFNRGLVSAGDSGGSDKVNWGLFSATSPDPVPLDSIPFLRDDEYNLIHSSNNYPNSYNYTLDGTGVDLIVIDASRVNPFHQDFYDYTGTYSRLQTIIWGEEVGLDPSEFEGDTESVIYQRLFTTESHYYSIDELVTQSIERLPSPISSFTVGTHGMNCLSIAGGRVFGWAKNATLYYMRNIAISYTYEIVRLFHEQKPIDPKTGYKRPTIVSHSPATNVNVIEEPFEGIYFSGSFYPGATLTPEYGFQRPYYLANNINRSDYKAYSNSIKSATDVGVIHVRTSGNSFSTFFRASPDEEIEEPIPDRYRSIHYNDYISSSQFPSYDFKHPLHHPPQSSLASVLVGALEVNTTLNQSASNFTGEEMPAAYSNNGGGVDIYAPSVIACAFSYSAYTSSFLPNTDPEIENPAISFFGEIRYTNGIYTTPTGTSYATPQVAGVACLYFQMNPGADVWQFKQFLLDHAKPVKFSPSENIDGPFTWGENNILLEGDISYTALNGAPTASLFWPYSSPNKSTGLPVFTK